LLEREEHSGAAVASGLNLFLPISGNDLLETVTC
jgi:hypothetical protein